MRLVYHPNYNISFFGIENLHPFDSKKYGRAWSVLQAEFGEKLSRYAIPVDRPVNEAELLTIHSADYLAKLRDAKEIASALELAPVAMLPAALTRWRVLRPMRWAARGSVLAAQAVMETGLAVNLSGGYHHAKPAEGEGFCIYSDIALLVTQLRNENRIKASDRIAYIDLDAHQGNGVCHHFLNDPSVSIFDMFNADIYPRSDTTARQRIDFPYPLSSGTHGPEYLDILQQNLPSFLDVIPDSKPALAIYNAGTDVFDEDQLGRQSLSAADILARDLFTITELRRRGIPTVMLLSGGYSQKNYQLVAATISALLHKYGNIT